MLGRDASFQDSPPPLAAYDANGDIWAPDHMQMFLTLKTQLRGDTMVPQPSCRALITR